MVKTDRKAHASEVILAVIRAKKPGWGLTRPTGGLPDRVGGHETESGTVDSGDSTGSVPAGEAAAVDRACGADAAVPTRRGAKARPAAMQANGMTGIR